MTILRDRLGRFRKSWFVGGGLVIGMGLMFGAAAFQSLFAKAEVQKPEVIKIDNLTPKIAELKKEVMTKLEKCESGGRKEEDGIVVLDSNDVGSYGVMQWQRKSVMYYYEKKTGTKINGRDAIILAMTADKARELAEWVIFETDSVLKDWKNCDKAHELTKQVEFIKKLK